MLPQTLASTPGAALGKGLAFFLLTLLGSGASLQAQDEYFVCDSGSDAIYRFVDANGDGLIDPALEVQTYYDDASPGPDLSVPSHLLVLGDTLLVSDSGTIDAVLAFRDVNGDGDALDDGETWTFYDDESPGPNLSTANGMALGPDGSVYVSDDGSGVRAILKLTDNNDDGDANDDGEVMVYSDESSLAITDPMSDPESVAVDPQGRVYVGDSATGRVVRLEDLNADGDALDPGEGVVFFSGDTPVAVTDIDALVVGPSGRVFVIDEDTGNVLVLEDTNGDGDALDPQEAQLFYDATSPGNSLSDPNDATLGPSGTLLVVDGALDTLLRLEDSNSSQFVSPDEVVDVLGDGGSLLSTPSGLGFRPNSAPITPPNLVSVQPSVGALAGGTQVTLAGTNLGGAVEIRFGGIVATDVVEVDDSTLQALTPPGMQPGPADVQVVTAGGSSILIAGFEYEAPTNLVITSVSPDRGSTAGGTEVQIAGSGWDPNQELSVEFGGLMAMVTSTSATEITVTTPPHPEATIHVVLMQGGASAIASGAYTYQTPFLRGDVDGNKTLDISDGIVLLNYLFVMGSSTPACLDAADIDDDGALALNDALLLLAYLFEAATPPAAPFPNPGLDPTIDGPGCAG